MSNEVIYWRGRGEERTDLIEILKSRGVVVYITRQLDEVLKHVKEQKPKAIIVDASSSEAEASERIVELGAARGLFDISVAFLAKRAAMRVEPLQQDFRNLMPFEVPFRISSFFSEFRPFASIVEEEDSAGQERAKRLALATAEQDPAHLVSTRGGRLLAWARDASAFDDELLLPQHPNREVLYGAVQDMTAADPWLGAHARRSAFVSSAIASSLGFGEKRDADLRTAGLMLNVGLSTSSAELRRLDLFRGDLSPQQVHEFAAQLKRTADSVLEDLGDDRTSRLIVVMAELIEGATPAEDRSLLRDAQCALGVELIDRACWRSGEWDLLGARRAFRHLRDSRLIGDRDISHNLGRVLGEAVANSGRHENRSFRFLDPELRKLRMHEAEEAVRQAADLLGKNSLSTVEVYGLEPGMMLARPLFSLDGVLLLPARTCLDRETIFRLWQLSTVRALRSPIEVFAAT